MKYLRPNNSFKFPLVLVVFSITNLCWADGLKVDKVYSPYVNALERELEYRLLGIDDSPATERHAFGYGQSLNDNMALEGYLSFESSNAASFELSSYELELRYQLSEQGEYSADWGFLAELEKSEQSDIWEAAVGVLSTRDWGKFTGTINGFIEYEWGDDIVSEFEFVARGQTLYRYRASFEPGLELHLGQDTAAAGPIAKGMIRQSPGTKWLWEFAVLSGLNNSTPNLMIKANLEFEFL